MRNFGKIGSLAACALILCLSNLVQIFDPQPAHTWDRAKFKAPKGRKAKKFLLSGRIVDADGRPHAGMPLYVWEIDGDFAQETRSDGNGEFEVQHDEVKPLTLEVNPPLNSGLAQALIPNLPGTENRKVVVTLKPGNLVTGKVMHAGKPLKGIILRVNSHGPSDNASHSIHAGGATITKSDGTFSMNLIDGVKKMYMVNDQYQGLPRAKEHVFTVDGAGHLGTLEF